MDPAYGICLWNLSMEPAYGTCSPVNFMKSIHSVADYLFSRLGGREGGVEPGERRGGGKGWIGDRSTRGRAWSSGREPLSVGEADRVQDGPSLGMSGADGRLRVELRRDERPIDPAPWLQ